MNANTNQNINDCDQEKFEVLVRLLSKIYEKGNLKLDLEIDKFEQAIKQSELGDAYFGVAKDDYNRIDILNTSCMPYSYQKDGVTFLAQYDDGMQAPFLVCKWKGSYLELEKLLKKSTKILYEYYLQELKK